MADLEVVKGGKKLHRCRIHGLVETREACWSCVSGAKAELDQLRRMLSSKREVEVVKARNDELNTALRRIVAMIENGDPTTIIKGVAEFAIYNAKKMST